LTLTGHTKSPRQLIVDSTHHFLYSCSADKKIIVHNFLNGTVIYEYKEFEKAVTNIAMNQQQHLLIASSLDGLIKIFNIQTYELIQQLTTSTSQSIISMIYKNNLVILNKTNVSFFVYFTFIYIRSIVEWKVVQLKYYNVMLIKCIDVK
jgi:WD40 repeat protein